MIEEVRLIFDKDRGHFISEKIYNKEKLRATIKRYREWREIQKNLIFNNINYKI